MCLVVHDWYSFVMIQSKLYPCAHLSIDSHIVLHPPLYIGVYWIPAIEYSNMPPLLMKSVAQTNESHYTLTTRIILNNTFILIHINGDNQSASNNQLVWTTKQNNQSFKLLLNVWAI